jgi:hypothetical protein
MSSQVAQVDRLIALRDLGQQELAGVRSLAGSQPGAVRGDFKRGALPVWTDEEIVGRFR